MTIFYLGYSVSCDVGTATNCVIETEPMSTKSRAIRYATDSGWKVAGDRAVCPKCGVLLALGI